MLLAQNTNAVNQASPLRRPFASAVWVTIAGGGAQFHVDFNEAPFLTRRIFMAMVKFKAKLKRPKMIPEKPKVAQNCSKGIKTARAAATHWFFENSVGNFLGLNISYITVQALPQCHNLQNKVILTIPCILHTLAVD